MPETTVQTDLCGCCLAPVDNCQCGKPEIPITTELEVEWRDEKPFDPMLAFPNGRWG